jgi:uncharacterized membrane protein YhaH (DUF805 family)
MEVVMREWLPMLILLAGVGQLGVLTASALVPFQLKWQDEFKSLPRLHRQMYWVYGGYVVLAIIAFGLLSLCNAAELAGGGTLARCLCGYMAFFWGIRICLQGVFDVKPFLRRWWLALGYHSLTVLFVFFTTVFGLAAVWPV